jgi:hypothetical protein
LFWTLQYRTASEHNQPSHQASIKILDIRMPSQFSIIALRARFVRALTIQPSVILEPARQPPQPQPTPKSNQLLSLPTEILGLIARFLPASSEAALTLTCQMFLHKLGNGSWKEINTPSSLHAVHRKHYCCKPEREAFIKLLDRDLEDLIYCNFCNILHSPSKTLSDQQLPTS